MTPKQEKPEWPENVSVPSKTPLKLVGENGNIFVILGRAKEAAKKAKWSKEQQEAFLTLAMAGDYDHVLVTCMKYFKVN